MAYSLSRYSGKHFIILVMLLSLFVYSSSASAAMDQGVLDTVLQKYQAAVSGWSTVMIKYASWLFWSLALMSMVWTFGMMAMQGDGLNTALAEIVRFFAVTGFFWYLLLKGPEISMSIIKSMSQIGGEAIKNGTPGFTPGSVTDIGFDLFNKVLDQSSVWSPVESTAGILIAILILGILAIVAVNLLLLFISAWILAYGGIFFLGFGGARWTSDMAIGFYKTVLSTGAQIMSMVLIIGIGKQILDSYYSQMSSGVSLKEMGVLFVVALSLLYLTNKIPAMIGGLAGGAGTGGIGSFGAGALAGAAASAAAIAATGGALAAAGATNAAGGADALRAAFQSAQAAMAEEGGSGGSGGGMGGGGEDTGNVDASGGNPSGSGGGSESRSQGGSGGISGGGSKGFAQSFSRAGRMAGYMASSLAEGMSARNAAKHESKMASARDAISQTAGGQLAAQIRAQTASRNAGPMVSDDTALQGAFASNNNNETGTDFAGDSLGGSEQAQNNSTDTGSVDEQKQQGSDEYEQFKNKQSF
ncbi:P-type conjugative transfer protein TrbL [Salmonella enterica]|nr:P-type conjugative transfer protein TrbL [Salmonella enterica]